ncbi:MAG TPA: hypothetical protein VHZ54_17240 [Solirubrobacterales bacterium]|nr:hypothetical protein [Solirubrobacterales bacterium]
MTQLPEGKALTPIATGHSVTIAATIAGASGSITCGTALTHTLIENPAGGGGGTGTAELEFNGCRAGGTWAECTVAFSGPAPIKFALGSTEGSPAITISPREKYLGTYTLSGCAVANNYKLAGEIKGRYSRALSQIEFDAASSGNGAFHLQSLGGPVATASGSIGLKTATGGIISAGTLQYSYAWSRCATSCTLIPGAVVNYYVPVSSDRGYTLKVSVTATNVSGNRTVTSAPTNAVAARLGSKLSWYTCGASKGGQFSDPACSKESAGGTYSWLKPEATHFNIGKLGEEVSPKIRFVWVVAGSSFQIQCRVNAEGNLHNALAGSTVTQFGLTVSECVSMSGNCWKEGQHPEFNFWPLKATVVEEGESKRTLKFVPETGTKLAEFYLPNCPLMERPRFTGYLLGQVSNKLSSLVFSGPESATGLSVNGAYPARVESEAPILGEGNKPVKLDFEP